MSVCSLSDIFRTWLCHLSGQSPTAWIQFQEHQRYTLTTLSSTQDFLVPSASPSTYPRIILKCKKIKQNKISKTLYFSFNFSFENSAEKCKEKSQQKPKQRDSVLPSAGTSTTISFHSWELKTTRSLVSSQAAPDQLLSPPEKSSILLPVVPKPSFPPSHPFFSPPFQRSYEFAVDHTYHIRKGRWKNDWLHLGPNREIPDNKGWLSNKTNLKRNKNWKNTSETIYLKHNKWTEIKSPLFPARALPARGSASYNS